MKELDATKMHQHIEEVGKYSGRICRAEGGYTSNTKILQSCLSTPCYFLPIFLLTKYYHCLKDFNKVPISVLGIKEMKSYKLFPKLMQVKIIKLKQ